MFRVLLILSLFVALPVASQAADVADTFKSRVMPVLAAHCTKCHGTAKPEAKLNLAGVRTLEQLKAESQHWFRVLEFT